MSRHGAARAPIVLLLPAALGALLLTVPLAGLVLRTPWRDAPHVLSSDAVQTALGLSLLVSGLAALASVLLGLPLGWLLARRDFPGRRLVRALVLLPMVLPPVVGGTALLFALGRRGVVGQWLDEWFGLTLPFTTAGAVLAATFVSLPFFVVTVEAALEATDPELEETANSLGAGPLATFWRVTLPTIRPAILAGVVLAWARALGEFGATITFAGDSPERTRTLPLAIFQALETDPDQALVLSMLLVVVSLGLLLSLRHRWLTGLR